MSPKNNDFLLLLTILSTPKAFIPSRSFNSVKKNNGPKKQIINGSPNMRRNMYRRSVSYTHLTLPTTPYV